MNEIYPILIYKPGLSEGSHFGICFIASDLALWIRHCSTNGYRGKKKKKKKKKIKIQ